MFQRELKDTKSDTKLGTLLRMLDPRKFTRYEHLERFYAVERSFPKPKVRSLFKLSFGLLLLGSFKDHKTSQSSDKRAKHDSFHMETQKHCLSSFVVSLFKLRVCIALCPVRVRELNTMCERQIAERDRDFFASQHGMFESCARDL